MLKTESNELLNFGNSNAYLKKEKKNLYTTTVGLPVIASGNNVTLTDIDGNTIIDTTGQVALAVTGLCNEVVGSAIEQQLRTVWPLISPDFASENKIEVMGDYYTVSRHEFAKTIIDSLKPVMPFDMRAIYEVSGANQINVLHKIFWNTRVRQDGYDMRCLENLMSADYFAPSEHEIFRTSLIACRNAFHGRHGIAQLLTNTKPPQWSGANSSSVVHFIPFPDKHTTAKVLLRSAYTAIKNVKRYSNSLFFAIEIVQGEGGINIAEPDKLKLLLQLLKDNNVTVLVDEVQTGLGRTGKMWALEHYDVAGLVDMVATSKALTPGVPCSIGVANAEAYPDFEPGQHSGSFPAAPLAIASGTANLAYMLKENIVADCAGKGSYFLEHLKRIQKRRKIITDTRGLGLMIGVDFKTTQLRDKLCFEALRRGALIHTTGSRSIRFEPSLTIPYTIINDILEIFDRTVYEISNK